MSNKLTQFFKNVFTTAALDHIVTALLRLENLSVICMNQIFDCSLCRSIKIAQLKVVALA